MARGLKRFLLSERGQADPLRPHDGPMPLPEAPQEEEGAQ